MVVLLDVAPSNRNCLSFEYWGSERESDFEEGFSCRVRYSPATRCIAVSRLELEKYQSSSVQQDPPNPTIPVNNQPQTFLPNSSSAHSSPIHLAPTLNPNRPLRCHIRVPDATSPDTAQGSQPGFPASPSHQRSTGFSDAILETHH